MRAWLLAAALAGAACTAGNGGNGGNGATARSSATFTFATPSASASASPSPSASATASPAPSPTALTSAKGFITVRQPLANARVAPPLVITGDASVFEANVEWRVTDTAGRVLAQGSTTASASAPARGTFTILASVPRPTADTIAFIEVFDRNPRDGSVDELVRVPIVIAP